MTASLDLRKPIGGIALRPAVKTVFKSNSLGHVLHEPVKCAVLRQPDALGQLSNMSSNVSNHRVEKHHTDKFIPKINRIDRGANEERFVAARSNGSSGALPVGTVSPMPNESAIQRTREGIGNHKMDSFGLQVANAAQLLGNRDDKLTASKVMSGMTSNDLMMTSGLVLRDENLCKLETEVSILKDQLEIQLKVNADLKKLLVASIGDDLHHKVDALVRTKIQLANEIDDYAKKLVEDYEDLDKMSIQSDIWHSKFKASRVLVDQLTSDKNRLSGMFCKAQTVLESLLSERQELQQHLLHSQRDLESVCSAMNLSTLDVTAKYMSKGLHTVDMARHVHYLAKEIRCGTAGTEPLPTSPRVSLDRLTPAEALAREVLREGSHGTVEGFKKSAFGRVLSFPLLQQHQPHTRFDGVTFNCCSHCKGQVFIV